MKHIMIDIETAGVTGKIPVLACAAVAFDPVSGECRTYLGFNETLTLDANVRVGHYPDGDTIQWWGRQSKEAQDGLKKEPRHHNVWSFCTALSAWISKQREGDGKVEVWCKPPTFDLEILKALFKSGGVDWPLEKDGYWIENDVRTLVKACKLIGIEAPKSGETAHVAMDDCVAQVYQVGWLLRRMKESSKGPVVQTVVS